MNNEHEWGKGMEGLLDDQMVAAIKLLPMQLRLNLVKNINQWRQQAYEEAVKEVDMRSGYTAGRQAAYTEILDELPKEDIHVAGLNEALSTIRDLIEKKQLSK